MPRSGSISRAIALCVALCVVSLALVLSGAPPVAPPLPALGPVVVKAWMVEDGLPQNTVRAVAQTRDGYIWCGTEMGLVRFNGTEFRTFNSWNTPQLRSNRITALLPDRSGGLLVGTDAGLAWLRDSLWREIAGSAGEEVLALGEDDAGGIWAGTRRGAWRVVDGALRAVALPSGPGKRAVHALLADRSGRLWAGGTGGLFLKGSPAAPGFRRVSPQVVTALGEDRDQRIWVGGTTGLYRVAGDASLTMAPVPELTAQPVSCLAGDRQGALWVGTAGSGIFRLAGGRALHLGGADGLPDEYVHAIGEDYEGNVWLGTASGGLSRLKPRIAGSLGRRDGLPENTVAAVLAGDDGTLWLGARHRGLVRWSPPASPQTVTGSDGLAGDEVTALCRTGDGRLWVGTTTGLSLLGGGKIRNYHRSDGLLAEEITALLADDSGHLWVGSERGLQRFPAVRQGLAAPETTAGMIVRSLVQDAGHRVWIGTSAGLLCGDGAKVERRWPAHGAPPVEVLSITVSRAVPGLLWLGTHGDGLVAFREGRVVRFTRTNGLPGDHVFAVQERLAPGQLWLSSFAGVFRLELAQVLAALDDPGRMLTAVGLNEEDGVIGRECTRRVWPSSDADRRGNLYFPTLNGLVVVGTATGAVRPPPRLRIEAVLADNRSIQTEMDPVLPTGLRLLEFYFAGLSFTAPTRNEYRYRLEGYDSRWVGVRAGQRPTVLYYNLAPGRYRFQVLGRNGDGVWNTAGTSFSFRVGRPRVFPWRWLLGLIPLLGVLAVMRFRMRRRQPSAPVAGDRPKYRTSALTPERAAEIEERLLMAFATDRLFLDPGMTLKKLAEKLRVHPNYLSQIINEKGRSFSQFINGYRIEEARKQLLDPQKRNVSILSIAYDTGFYSKSVFNTAFKKITGQTPSQFRAAALASGGETPAPPDDSEADRGPEL
ncbi:MAG TPA: two-component regulator propeller domain-containing protein [Candidatus Aminicenantes bacterium]|nr:two-component regulator propeller domain-containing protein [Candidatus Aminicenantes bacterium]